MIIPNTIFLLSKEDLCHKISSFGFPSYRGEQVYDWLHRKQVQTYSEMNNIPKDLRVYLSTHFPIMYPEIISTLVSKDGSAKFLLKLQDGALTEMLLIPALKNGEINRLSLCFSTQVGCPMECSFCATGKEGFTRNLEALEIYMQILLAQKEADLRITNLLAMGQGEPFLNFDAVVTALELCNCANNLNISARHICVSTCGIIDKIDQFSTINKQYTLAISLHSARQSVRNIIMPKQANQDLKKLKKSLLSYVNKTKRRVTLEYIMLKDINDSEKDLKALQDFCKGLLCHVNLLFFNSVDGVELSGSKAKTLKFWEHELTKHGIDASIRTPRGNDIFGACGQFKNFNGGFE